ncbi:hypothetical protein QE152_g2056 [Popillia japonica]|uniref:Uncharacterized protein n=1 Tax=Popillia japonica TaxID=7064 RepID=A0AAW1N4T7_POPJA
MTEESKRYNKKRAEVKDYQPGTLVMIKRKAPSTGESRKLQEKYKEPYVIVEQLLQDRYPIKDMPETQRNQKFYRGVAAVDALKPFPMQNPDESDETNDDDYEDSENEMPM